MDTIINVIGSAIIFVEATLRTAAVKIAGALLWFTNLCMHWFGWAVGRIPFHGPIMAVLLVAGFIMVIKKICDLEDGREDGVKALDGQLFGIADRIEMLPIPGAEGIASFVGLYNILLYLMYYPCAFIVGLFWAVSGHGASIAFFTGMISKDMPYTFFNYPLWDEAPKYLCAVVVVKLAMKTVGAICRRDFKGLLRTGFLTLDAALLGSLVGMLYIWMQVASEGNFILTVLFLIPSFAVYIIYPYIMLALIMPLILITLPVIGLILLPIAMFAGGAAAGLGEGALHQAKTDSFVKGDILTYKALDRAEQGKFGLLIFVDILNM